MYVVSKYSVKIWKVYWTDFETVAEAKTHALPFKLSETNAKFAFAHDLVIMHCTENWKEL